MKLYDSDRERSASPDRVKVGVADYAVVSGDARITTSGLGSCLGVALTDSGSDVAGLAHVMLPTAETTDGDAAARFADTGIERLVAEMEAQGADRATMEARLAGGSNMLDLSGAGGNVGCRNVTAARETLAELDVPVVGEDVCGSHGRSLTLDAGDGRLIVDSAHEGVTTL